MLAFPDDPHTASHDLAVVRGSSPLDVAEATFRLLATGPGALAVNGRTVGHGLPRRPIPLVELASVLMHPSTTFAARDAVWRLLVERARADGPTWVVGAVGVALPGLRAAANRLARAGAASDVEADLLAGFLAALPVVDVDQPRVCARLCNAAYGAARAAARAAAPATSGEANFAPGSATPPRPWGHPDFVLARAAARGVISARDADLIAVTRLEDLSLRAYAERTGESRWAAYKRRARAEARLVAAIRAGQLASDEDDVIAEATLTAAPEPRPNS